jgi:dipicolinate synthase subunit A
MRFASLAEILHGEGHTVRCYALERSTLPELAAGSLRDAARGADCVVLPLPVTAKADLLNAPLSDGEYSMKKVLDALDPGSVVCAGRVDEGTARIAHERGLELVDYFLREELIVYNGVATAEGAVALIMQDTPVTLWRSRVLVVGFGHIGKLVADRLKALGAEVWVSARKYGDMAWIEALGMRALDTRALEGHLGMFDVVVNTVPAPVLGEARLREIKKTALCVDLASKPGGADGRFG